MSPTQPNSPYTMPASDDIALRALLTRQPIAALSTLHRGRPAVSMVPFAMLPCAAGFVIHVSRLAAHTGDMIDNPDVALLVAAPLSAAETPLALPRASISGRARRCLPESDEYGQARTSYLAKLPAAEELFAFADFSLFIVEAESIRYVAGFGSASTFTGERLRAVLGGDNA